MPFWLMSRRKSYVLVILRKYDRHLKEKGMVSTITMGRFLKIHDDLENVFTPNMMQLVISRPIMCLSEAFLWDFDGKSPESL